MNIYGANQVAAEADIDPRALRRFLRTNPSYRNAGMGGRYMFTEAEKNSLIRAFKAAHSQGPAKQPEKRILDDDPGVPVEKLGRHGLTPSLRAQRQAARALRQQRLRSRIDAVLAPRYDDEEVKELS